jgi:hypothetical protein
MLSSNALPYNAVLFPDYLHPFIPYIYKPKASAEPFANEIAPTLSPYAINITAIRDWLNACDEAYSIHCRQSQNAQGHRSRVDSIGKDFRTVH